VISTSCLSIAHTKSGCLGGCEPVIGDDFLMPRLAHHRELARAGQPGHGEDKEFDPDQRREPPGLVSTGSGVTLAMGILCTIRDLQSDLPVTLIYGSRIAALQPILGFAVNA
jgi:hypothetical protein